jgi:hypothetical protein
MTGLDSFKCERALNLDGRTYSYFSLSDAEIVPPGTGICEISVTSRIDTLDEFGYFKHGGILTYVLRQLAA